MARALTAKSVENLKPGEVRREVPDPALAGLYLVVQPTGAKSWALRYRAEGKTRKLTLGRFPRMGVAEARSAATEALQAVEMGADPAAEKQAAKKVQEPDRDTVLALVDLYDKRHLSKLRRGYEVRRALDRYVVSRWGDRHVQGITRRDIRELLDEIDEAGKATMANRLRLYLSGLFNWSLERDVIEVSPMAGIKARAEKPRDRVLSDDEISWLWKACDEVPETWGALTKILLLTAQRLGEVAQMTYDELEGNVWHLSADRTKNARAHDVPLSKPALEVLDGKVRIRSKYVFTTTGTAPVSGFYKARNALGEAMARIAAEERGEPVEIDHWTFHDIRRTCATTMARLRVPVRVTEAVLNHVSGTGGGIVAVYQRHDYADEKRQAIEALGAFVMDLVDGPKGDNVVRIEATR